MDTGAEENFISKNRLEALVDGVFAFAMTLLVISLAVPSSIPAREAARELPALLLAMRPAFTGFLIAFFILGSYWLHHHQQFHYLRSADRIIVRLTLLILVCVVLVPFTTSLSGDYANVQVAVVLFHLNLFALAMSFFIQWQYIVRSGDITVRALEDHEVRPIGLGFLTSAGIALLGVAVSFASPDWSMAVYLLLIPMAMVRRRLAIRDRKNAG